MILPIYAYGQTVLKTRAEEIGQDFEGLEELIADMWETMYHARGVGLAAPQIGHSIRLFIVDTQQLEDEESDHKGIKQVFINAELLDENGDPWEYEEGCLSIPDINGDVERLQEIRIRFHDESFQPREERFSGINARVIQHEYDHIEGILFTERLKPIKKRRIKRKLDSIRKGEIETRYPMRFARK